MCACLSNQILLDNSINPDTVPESRGESQMAHPSGGGRRTQPSSLFEVTVKSQYDHRFWSSPLYWEP